MKLYQTFVYCTVYYKPSHWVCNPAYLVSVPSQDKLEGLWQEGHSA